MVVAAAAFDGPAFVPRVESRREDGSVAFFRTVFIRIKTFPNPFFSFSLSFGTVGPPWAGELMLAVVVELLWCRGLSSCRGFEGRCLD